MINEAAEEEYTPSKAISPRQSVSPSTAPTTPISRRRSTGSTPHSTPASGPASTPGGGVYSNTTQGRSGDEERRSSAPTSMEITNGSSPLTPGVSISTANQPVLASPSPTSDTRPDHYVASPSSYKSLTTQTEVDDNTSRDKPSMESTSIFNVPKLNLTGLKRVVRRPSGHVVEDESKAVQSLPIPSTSTGIAELSTYSSPPSVPPTPSTPPRINSIVMPGSRSPTTPNRTLPMSPNPANPALSPPPGRKLSLTRRQLDFGIPEPEEVENDDNNAELDAVEPPVDGLLSFQSDSVVGKRAAKRKDIEEDERDDIDVFSTAVKSHGVRAKRQERRRDTGNALTLKDKESRESLLKERGSKDSLRDVTNERTPPSLIGSKPIDIKDFTSPAPKAGDAQTSAIATSAKSQISRGTLADLAAKLERMSSRPKPLSAPAPIPLPSSDKDVKLPLAEEEAADEAAEAAAAEMGRRGSGRQRKSVNYKEPSLNT